MKKISMFGVGAWATAIAMLLAKNNASVSMWSYKQSHCDALNTQHKSPRLPGVSLSPLITATTDPQQCLKQTDLIAICMPSQYMFDTVKRIQPFVINQPILCLTKGFINHEALFLSQFFKEMLPKSEYSYLSGPNLASEIAAQKPAAAVVGSHSVKLAKQIQEMLSQTLFRVYTTSDIRGLECAGILKNILAIAAGCSDAMGYGANAKAALVTRGLQELIRFATMFGAEEKTFYGLAGIGDIIATCSSTKSRNYQLGLQLGKGVPFVECSKELVMVAEGVSTLHRVHEIAQDNGIEMPITETLYQLITEPMSPHVLLEKLMARHLKEE